MIRAKFLTKAAAALNQTARTGGSHAGHRAVQLLALACFSIMCAIKAGADDSQENLLNATPKIEVYDIRQHRTGLAYNDAITVIVDTLEAEYSIDLENEAAQCVNSAFRKSNYPSVQVVAPEDFRRVAFPGLAAEQVLNEPWRPGLKDALLRERDGSLRLRYLIAVTVSQDSSFAVPNTAYGERQEFVIFAARIVAVNHSYVAGKLTASVRQTSTAIPALLIGSLSLVRRRACEEFGAALVKFLASEEQPPEVYMSSLTLDNLFPQRRAYREPLILTKPIAPDLGAPNSLLLGREVATQFREQNKISALVKSEETGTPENTTISRWDEIRPLIKARKDLVVHEDAGVRWRTGSVGAPVGFEDAMCSEAKLTVNTLTLNTSELPPLPSWWHLAPVWLTKLATLPMLMAIPTAQMVPFFPFFNPMNSVRLWAELISCMVHVNHRAESGMNSENVLERFVRASQSSAADVDGTTDIHDAALMGNSETVRLLIEGNDELANAKNKAHQTPLHLAASNGHGVVVKLLLSNDVDINARDWQGATALQLAAKNGHTHIVRILREHGGSVRRGHQCVGVINLRWGQIFTYDIHYSASNLSWLALGSNLYL